MHSHSAPYGVLRGSDDSKKAADWVKERAVDLFGDLGAGTQPQKTRLLVQRPISSGILNHTFGGRLDIAKAVQLDNDKA